MVVRLLQLHNEFISYAVARSHGDPDALAHMIDCARRISPRDALGVTRALTQTLNLVNAAEVHHRVRQLRESDRTNSRLSALPLVYDSVAGTMERLLLKASCAGAEAGAEEGAGLEEWKDRVFRRLLEQKVDLVLTAHPTEVNRRTLLRKYRDISEQLAELDKADLTPFERQQVQAAVRREVASIWGSDEIRRQKPTPQQEARGGLAILESVLWDAVPSYLRKLSQQCRDSLQRTLPIDHVPVRFNAPPNGDRVIRFH